MKKELIKKLIKRLGVRYETRHVGEGFGLRFGVSQDWKDGIYRLRTGWWWWGIPIRMPKWRRAEKTG